MRLIVRAAIAAEVAMAAAMLTASVSAAAIKCRNDFQLVAGNYISTPYCRDNYIAKVASEYGMKAPAAEVRNNPNFKRNVCRLIGRDIRISDACAEVNPWDKGRF